MREYNSHSYKMEVLKHIRCFVLDMDGTIYLGNELFAFTPAFLDKLNATGKDYCFFTNNSSKNADCYIQKLHTMNIAVKSDRMFTSNQVVLDYILRTFPQGSVYVLGTSFLKKDFTDAGITVTDENPDAVIVGFDTTLTYAAIQTACDLVREGKPYFGVNPDLNCPVEGGGWMPDCGLIARLIEGSTGRTPEYFGKPSHRTLAYIVEKTGYAPSEIAIVGDRLYTDIALADGNDVTSILVLTGEAQLSDLPSSKTQPDLIVESIAEITELLSELG